MHNLQALRRVCTPVTIDLLGHGQSPAPEDERLYLPCAYVAALENIRLQLKTEQWFVCGYSIGAGITIRYAIEHAPQVLGHLFTNSSSGFADSHQISKWRKDADLSANNILEGGLAAIERIAVHPKFAKRLPADVYQALLRDARNLAPVGVANTLKQTTPNVSIRELAQNNSRPALLCFGHKETRFAAAKEWAVQHMPNLTIAELDAGHAVNMEDSAGFNRCATEFIQQHTP